MNGPLVFVVYSSLDGGLTRQEKTKNTSTTSICTFFDHQ